VLPRDLAAILDFMYHGEVNVKQDHLNSFLAVAERLRVRGLCQNDGTRPSSKPAGPSTVEKSKARVLDLQRNPEPAAKRPRPSHPATPVARDQDDGDKVEELPPQQVKLEELAAEAAQGPGIRHGSLTQHFAAAAEAQGGHGGHYPMAEAGYEESMQGGSGYGDYSGYEDEMGYMEAGGGQGGVDPTLASKGRRGAGEQE
jgi:hypothetical protein